MLYLRAVWILVALAIATVSTHAGTLAQFRTVLGDLEVELYDQQKPVTVNNFKRLVQSGAYQNTFFHRVIPGFVAQGGGYFTVVPNNLNPFGPNWFNLEPVPSFGAISNEFSVGPFLSNTNGTIAMAKPANSPNSATREWFFNLGNNSTNLDNQNGGFTVFGHVVRDTGPTATGGLLGFFNQRSYTDGIVNMGWWFPADPVATNLFTTLAVTYPGSAQPRYADLFYVDVSLLTVEVTRTNNQQQISWNSVNGKTNYIEYTTVMPPVWQQLAATNGNGNRLTVGDPAPTNAMRFYRVRVIY